MNELTKSEETLLLSIWRLKDNAYGVSIRRKVSELTKKVYTYGALYSALDQLVSKGFVVKQTGEPTSKRGGRRKIFYTVSPLGLQSLKDSLTVQKAVWGGIDELSLDRDL